MKHFMAVPIALVVLAACQTPPPTPAPTAVVGPPANTATTVPAPTPAEVTVPTVAPTATPEAAPTLAPTSQPTAAPTQAPAARDVFVSADGGLNLRAEPSATATLLQLLASGTHLTAIGQPTAPDAAGIAWQSVRTDDQQSGWVASQYLSDAAPEPIASAPPATTAPVADTGYVYVASVGGLNMRAQASVSSSILTMLANGQRLETNHLSSGPDANGITWLNVRTEDGAGLVGWVSAEFVSAQVPSVAPAPPPANISDAAAEILRRTNELRAQHGLSPLALDGGLTQLALAHSQYMAQNGITHTGAGGLSAKQRIANAGYGGRPTENIYGGQATIDQAWDYWASDPPHLDNLLNAFNSLVGIGVYQTGLLTYYTMDFAAPSQ